MEPEEDEENHSLADQAPPKGDMQGLKQEVLRHSNSLKRIFSKGRPGQWLNVGPTEDNKP